MDLSTIPDAELAKALGLPAQAQDSPLAKVSDGDLMAALGIKPPEKEQAKAPAAPREPGYDKTDPRFSDSAMVGAKFFEGIPIAGAAVPHIGAAVAAAAQPLTGSGSPGETFNERRLKNLEQERAASRGFDAENPVLSPAVKIGGGVAATLPLAATSLGARVLGLTGQSLPGQVARSAASGAAIGGADAAVRGEDVGHGAAFGGMIGAAAPPVGRLIGKAVEGIRDRVAQPDIAGSGTAKIMRAINDDALTPQTLAQRAADLGPEATLADMGPNLRGQAGALASAPGPGQQVVIDAMKNRQTGAGARITSDLDNAMGGPIDTGAEISRITAQRSAQAAPAYDTARSIPIQSTPIIDKVLETPFGRIALQRAEKLASSDIGPGGSTMFGAQASSALPPPGSTMTAAQFRAMQAAPAAGRPVDVAGLDLVKQAFDDMIESAKRAGNGNQSRILSNLKNNLVQEVDAQTTIMPATSAYKAARDVYAGHSSLIEALEMGQGALKRDMTAADITRTMAGMSAAERDAFIHGIRSDIASTMGNARNDAGAVRASFQKGAVQEKLEAALGPVEARKLIGSVQREGTFHDTSQQVTQNSLTRARMSAGEEFPSSVATPKIPHGITLADAAMFLPRKMASAILGSAAGRRANQVSADSAAALMAKGAQRDALIDAIRRATLVRAASRQTGEMVGRGATAALRGGAEAVQ